MNYPNFFIVGAMKAGTTWLALNLNDHPDVFIPKDELHFFNSAAYSERGLQWYQEQFNHAGGAKAIGEKTAGYLLHPDTPRLLAEHYPGARIIVVLRNPVARAISQINHHIRNGDITPYIDQGSDNFFDSEYFAKIDEEFAILERGRYFEQIQRYYDVFDKKKILIIINEVDIKKRPQITLTKTCKFLSVDAHFKFPKRSKKIHQNRNSKIGTLLAYNTPVLGSLIKKIDRLVPGRKKYSFTPRESEIEKIKNYYNDENRKLFNFMEQNIPEEWQY